MRTVSAILEAGLSREDASRRTVQAVAEAMGWDAGAVWIADPSQTALRVLATWISPSCTALGLEELNRRRTFTPGLAFPGRVWVSAEAVGEFLVPKGPDTQRIECARRAGLTEAIGFPIVLGSRTVGIFEFWSRGPAGPDASREETLREAAARFVPVLAASGDKSFDDPFFAWSLELACVAGPDGYFKQVNPAWEKVLGLSPAELLSTPFLEFIHPDDRQPTMDETRKIFAGEPAVTFENRYRAKDGNYRWLSWTCPAPRIGDEVLYAVARDVTNQKRAEESLRQTEERFRLLVEGVKDYAVSMLGPDGRIASWNAGAERILGYRAGEIYGRSLSEFFPDRDARSDRAGRILQGARAEGRFEEEGWLVRKDGSRLWCRMTLSVLTGEGESLRGFALVVRDVTERKRIEEERERVNEQLLRGQKLQGLGQLAAGVAHEINNPVGYILSNLHTLREYFDDFAVVLGNAEQLADCSYGSDAGRAAWEALRKSWEERRAAETLTDFRDALEETRQGTERIRDIVRSLKEFSHSDEGELKPTDLNKCIDDALKICWNEVKYKAEVQKEYGDLPPVVCYPQRLGQVFLNLLVNAAQAMPQRGEIRIRTALEGDHAVVRIGDTGSGIPPENMKRIFEPFFTTKPVGKGTGLGLHVVYKIIEAHSGKIEVRSEVDRGTEFTLRIPVGGPGGRPA